MWNAEEVCDGKDNNGNGRIDESGCAVTPVTDGAHSYLFVPQAKTWSDARAYCTNIGYHLVTVNTAAEQEFLDRVGAGVPFVTTYWIGFSDLAGEGRWAWDSGELITYQNWYTGQPDNAWAGEHCAEMHFWDGRVSRWNDMGCTALRHFICEAP